MESPEYKTLVQCYPELVTIVQQSPNVIADHPAISTKLAPGKLQYLRNLSHENEDKARKLLDSIKDQVKIDPQVFHHFKSALKSQGDWTKAAVDKLESTFKECSAITNSLGATSSVQETDFSRTSERRDRMAIKMDSVTEMELKFVVKRHESSEEHCCNVLLQVKKEDTIRNVKEIIQKELGIQCSEQELKYEEKLMEDDDPLSAYNVHGESTIQLLITKSESTGTENMSEEEIIFRENYCKLVKTISEPDKFAAQLYAANLVTAQKRDEVINKSHESPCSRVMRLMSATEIAIKHLPEENFRKFIKVLCEESSYESLARLMHSDLAEECIQELRREEEPMLTDNIQTEQGSPEFFTIDEAWIRVKDFEERFDTLTLDLQEEICELVEGNENHLRRVRHTITRLPNEIKSEYDRFLEKLIDPDKRILHSSTDVEELFDHLNVYCSFFDYSLIEHLIKKHGSPKLNDTMRKYAKDMKEFRQKTSVKTFAHVWIGEYDTSPPEKFTILAAKLKKDPAHCTLEELDRLRKEFCAAYHLSESALILYHCRPGSVIIYWQLPIQFTRELMSTIKRVPIEVFCISRKIGGLYVGEIKVYSDMPFERITVPAGQKRLIPLLKRTGSECMNALEDHPYEDALIPGPLQCLKSDVDEQLIMFFDFKVPIKLHSIHISGPLSGQSPKTIRLFINQPHCLDFEQAENQRPLEELIIKEKDTHKDSLIRLNPLKFRNVSSLTIFIKDNQGGGDQTVVHHIDLFGQPVEALDMSHFQRVAGVEGEEHEHEWQQCPHDRYM